MFNEILNIIGGVGGLLSILVAIGAVAAIKRLFAFPDIAKLDMTGLIVYCFYSMGTLLLAAILLSMNTLLVACVIQLKASGLLEDQPATSFATVFTALGAVNFITMLACGLAFTRLYKKTFP